MQETVIDFLNVSKQYMDETKPIPTIDLGPRKGYPPVGTVIKLDNEKGRVLYTETGLVFYTGKYYGKHDDDDSEDW